MKKAKLLIPHRSSAELVYATGMQLRAEGKGDAASVVQEMISTPNRASKYQKAFKTSINSSCDPNSLDEALSLFVDAKLTKSQYNLIRKTAKETHCNTYPCY